MVHGKTKSCAALLLIFSLLMGYSTQTFAHCDTMEGPVVASAREAIETGDVNKVLFWVREQDENRIRALFDRIMQVRELDPQVRELADRYFFETLVRIHREGEGAPYTGLKSGEHIDPAVRLADKALSTGTVDELVEVLTGAMEKKIREKFQALMEKKDFDVSDLDAGREYVEAYVSFTHLAEGLHALIQGQSAHKDHLE